MSGRDELLNEAIAKAKEAEDWQLADWLRMARGGESAARWYAEKLRELKAENAKLLVRLTHMELHECPACANVADLQESLDENDRLLELITDVHEALCADKAGIFHGSILASMEDDMRKLGIEVTGK